MTDSVVDRLCRLTPEERVDFIQAMYEKNRRYFVENHPRIDHIIKNLGDNPYQLNLTEDFLEIIYPQDPERSWQGGALDEFARSLGDWSHKSWIEFVEPNLQTFSEQSWHGKMVSQFNRELADAFPAFQQMVDKGMVNLPASGAGRCFSNSVLFVGIFHGLHIDYFLSRTDITNVTLVEPDPYRFEVSLYFFDYSTVTEKADELLLHVGEGIPDEFLDVTIHRSFVSSNVWLRILPGYASESIEAIVKKVRLRWLSMRDVWVPADRELSSLCYGMLNLQKKKKLLAKQPRLSRHSRIAVIGAGPSLSNDLKWLQQNQNKIIIFASHSSVRFLLDNDIVPDFQFALDVDWSEAVEKKLQLDQDIPFVVNYQTAPGRLLHFKNIMMVAGETIASPAIVHKILPYMYPTTGNMAFAFAYYCKPSELFLLGLDFSFRSTEQQHVKGSHYDTPGSPVDKTRVEADEARSNFPENGSVLTKGYYELARSSVEKAMASSRCEGAVYNMSDGVFLQGAVPRHSERVKLPAYLMKKTDIAEIRAAFENSKEGKLWTAYELPGDVLLEKFKKRMEEVLCLETFTHKDFTIMVDNCQFLVNETCKKKSKNDSRMIPYLRVVRDMLISWYRFMLFAYSTDDIRTVYENGFEILMQIVSEFRWSESCDSQN